MLYNGAVGKNFSYTGGMEVRRLREKANLTQQAVASALDITRSAVGKWEVGVSMPRLALIPTLAALYGCTVDDIVSRSHAKDTDQTA